MSNSNIKPPVAKPARRLVTGINSEGCSYLEKCELTPSFVDYGRAASSEIWVDDGGVPAVSLDRVGPDQCLLPPTGGSVCRVFEMRPEGAVATDKNQAKKFEASDVMERSEIDGPRWHTTPTLDYGFVLRGKIELLLDDGPHLLEAGDVIVQRGTRHAWRNPGPNNCVIAFVLIDRENKIINQKNNK